MIIQYSSVVSLLCFGIIISLARVKNDICFSLSHPIIIAIMPVPSFGAKLLIQLTAEASTPPPPPARQPHEGGNQRCEDGRPPSRRRGPLREYLGGSAARETPGKIYRFLGEDAGFFPRCRGGAAHYGTRPAATKTLGSKSLAFTAVRGASGPACTDAHILSFAGTTIRNGLELCCGRVGGGGAYCGGVWGLQGAACVCLSINLLPISRDLSIYICIDLSISMYMFVCIYI